MKTCSKCQETKPLDQFGKQTGTKDGLRSQCKECRREQDRIGSRARRQREQERAHYHG